MWLCRESCIVNGEAGTALPGLQRPSALETGTCAPCPGLPQDAGGGVGHGAGGSVRLGASKP